jgi:hypothetical protein
MATWDEIRKRIFATESGGDYNALYGYQNRQGGLFDDVKITDMTVDDALDFANPKGRYGAFVSTQTPDNRIATPMGAYQVVGRTLRDAKSGLGLKGDELMTPALQDKIGKWIYDTQGEGAWEGLKGRGNMDGKTGGILGAMQNNEEDTPFYKRDSFKDMIGNLAIGLNSMRLNPDPNLAKVVQGQQAQRKQAAVRNKSIEALQRAAQGGDAMAAKILQGIQSEAISPAEGFKFWYSNQLQGQSPKYKTLTGSQINASMGSGLDPDKLYNVSPDGKITQVGGSAPSITVGPQETEWAKGMAKAGVDQLNQIRSDATAAQGILNQTAALRNLMSDPNFDSGAFAESKMGMKRVIEALGGDPANVESMEAFKSVTSQLILDKMGGSLGAGFSEGDRKFVEQMVPQISATKSGNMLIIALNEAIAKRKMQINDFANQYIKENGMIDANFDAALRKWAKENPMANANKYFEG